MVKILLESGKTVTAERDLGDTGYGYLEWVPGRGTCLTIIPDSRLEKFGRIRRVIPSE
jgi:hypothetical protein